jgi:hypothetical protein
VSSRRSILATAALSISVLSACGASAPPAKELADEMIDTLDVAQPVKDCMHKAVADFSLTEQQAQGFKDLDDVAEKAAGGNELAKQIMTEFQSALAACT